MADILIIAVVGLIVCLAAGYVYRQRKRGVQCIGCPESCSGGCGGNCAGCSGGCANSHK